VPYAHWIAPGFDTIFYLARAPGDSRPRPGGSQTVDVGWFEPRRALEIHRAGKMPMGYPAIKQLESLIGFESAADALYTARHLEVVPIRLRLVGDGDKRRPVLPGDAQAP
jgi:hypothetical protein